MPPGKLAQPPLRFRRKRAILQAYQERNHMTYYVAQLQPHNDEVEVLYFCTSEEQAEDACDMLNASLDAAGIPSTYHAYVLY